ncbi:MAG: hypothetical protein CMM95_00750 [Rickettsiales bacterium]|nr:hypothetical protein [Rickettsiales bacterium]|tara:strand:+ start:272 stop:1099 length:828 start_codon:yes stop_codon:yes gene_type:complete
MKIDKFNLDDGTYIRFKKIGKGQPILLLHTFRNRLEYSDKLGKLLEDKFTVYSIDLPGFGDSPINTNTNYDLNFFTKSIVDFLKKLKIKNITIAGESIGANLAASVSVKLPQVVKEILLFNPYNYDSYFGQGIQRGNFFAKFILFHISLPIIGNLFSSLENKFILKNVMYGGFFDNTKLPDNYLDLLSTSIRKKGYVYHFRTVLSKFNKNNGIKEVFKNVNVPVKLFYGKYDWANELNRLDTQNLLKLDRYDIINNSVHFSFLENFKEVSQIIKR